MPQERKQVICETLAEAMKVQKAAAQASKNPLASPYKVFTVTNGSVSRFVVARAAIDAIGVCAEADGYHIKVASGTKRSTVTWFQSRTPEELALLRDMLAEKDGSSKRKGK